MARTSSYIRGTRVALYLRRSTSEHQEESLDTQRASAREYCAARGWVIVDEFVDDAVSRAEFKKRPSLHRMLRAAKAGAFELVVMRDESRLGGDMIRTSMMILDFHEVGVGIVYYINDELVVLDRPTDKLLLSVRNYGSEMEREKISSRTYEHLVQKAKAGKPAGGISYGYAIKGDKNNKEFVVDQAQAAVVRRIFAMYAAGEGQRTIAMRLNEEHVPSPRHGRRGTGSWAPSAIRVILTNPRYVGEGRYNQWRKVYRGGTKVREQRPAAEHFTYPCPAIVDREMWQAVSRRFDSNVYFGTQAGTKGARARYLITGMASCTLCGGPMTVGRRWIKSVNTNVYMCGWRKNRGPTVCPQMQFESVESVDHRITEHLRWLVTDQVIARAVQHVRESLAERQATLPAETARLQTEIDKLKREIGRLTTALATTDSPPPSLLEALTERDKRVRQLEVELAQASAAAGAYDEALDAVELEARRRLRALQKELQDPARAREALSGLIAGERLQFAPDGPGYKIRGTVTVASLLQPATADDDRADCMATPTGIEPVLPT